MVIGVGAVGSTTAYTLLRGRMEELVLIDSNKAKAIGDALDMNHGLPFGQGLGPAHMKIAGCRHYYHYCRRSTETGE